MVHFFFNDTATTELYTLSLHDALPISRSTCSAGPAGRRTLQRAPGSNARSASPRGDRKSTRLNSSHVSISYAVFCLKKNTQPDVDWFCEQLRPCGLHASDVPFGRGVVC